ncbi:MAG: hypothetical protein ACXVAX_12350 [Pseudobdellovibrio sp.]
MLHVFFNCVSNVAGGKLYISCDDSGDLKNVILKTNKKIAKVSCE